MKILMAFIIALVVGMWIERVTAPKSGAPLDAIKTKNVVREFYKIRDAANMEAYNNDFNTTTVSTSTTTAGSGMSVSGGNLISSQHTSITFTPIHGSTAGDKEVQVTISGLDNITGAEAKVKSTIDSNTDFDITDSDAADGILVIKWDI